ncbi:MULTISPECIES: hypothetical protein [Pseudoalteromonas]|uniref:hypothetical protein n=2 Tax=Pseudoalteromonas TaxID=53246 RepID=UPI0003639E05|nr:MULTISPECIES: hypothetical protein [Pseudoalteromonas]
MYINDIIGPYIGVFIEWGFLMVFLYNLVLYINNPNKSIVILSMMMAISYVISDLFPVVSPNYLNWLVYDLLTIVALGLWIKHKRISSFPAICYVVCGLSLNALIMAAIYYDLCIRLNVEYWWLWPVYSFGVNLVDIMMITALVLNKDYLGLMRLLRKAGLLKA